MWISRCCDMYLQLQQLESFGNRTVLLLNLIPSAHLVRLLFQLLAYVYPRNASHCYACIGIIKLTPRIRCNNSVRHRHSRLLPAEPLNPLRRRRRFELGKRRNPNLGNSRRVGESNCMHIVACTVDRLMNREAVEPLVFIQAHSSRFGSICRRRLLLNSTSFLIFTFHPKQWKEDAFFQEFPAHDAAPVQIRSLHRSKHRLLRRRLLPLVSAAAFETHLSPSPNPFSQCRTPTKTLNQESFPSDSFRESGVEVIVLILSINSGKILGEEVDQRLRCSLRSDLASICCPSLISDHHKLKMVYNESFHGKKTANPCESTPLLS
ncbi:hypothetical protein MUK42_28702 [Musa troglodytarum]|uniref:Uncharacterized protein n=1 Tax=Musa troglodytarum TaxID=320322 RepID=A0A9E7HM88_9LILI|nr:hypothetical protein MUK42_28702 [Musa troglodytarum]